MTQVSIDQAVQIAMEHHRAGRFGEAESIYRQIIQAEPGHAQVLYMLGLLMHQSARHAEAIQFVRGAIAISPRSCRLYVRRPLSFRPAALFAVALRVAA